jgi:hypothetical protein
VGGISTVACAYGALVNVVHVLDVQVQGRRRRRAFPRRTRSSTANHQHRVSDFVFRMKATGRAEAVHSAFGAKNFGDEFNLLVHVRHRQIWRDRPEAFANFGVRRLVAAFFLAGFSASRHRDFKLTFQARFESLARQIAQRFGDAKQLSDLRVWGLKRRVRIPEHGFNGLIELFC